MDVTKMDKLCVGCGACIDICPMQALIMDCNEDGFYEPQLDNKICISCGKCITVCPAITEYDSRNILSVYYGWNRNENIRMKSTSGGAFYALAKEVLEENGLVFGAVYNSDFVVTMESTENVPIEKIMQTKYCQSNYNNIFRKIEKGLSSGKKVLVCATPCQIAAIDNYFGNNERLILVDFFCGGVAPQTAFSNYLNWIENKYKSKVAYINMRSKRRGWSKPYIQITFENGKSYLSHYQFDYYLYYSYSPLLKNEACIECNFFNHDVADITIGDFWGFRKEKITNDEKGLSLICIHTRKGNDLFEKIKNKTFETKKLQLEQVKYAFTQKKQSVESIKERRRFMDLIKTSSFVNAAKNNHFRGGKIGVILKYIIRKVKG